MANVLVIDDEQAICWALRKILEREGHAVTVAGTAEKGLEAVEASPPDVVLLDVRLPGMDGLEALRRLRESGWGGEVIVITAHGTMETAVEAIHGGAFDVLTKPLDAELVKIAVTRAAKAKALSQAVSDLKARLAGREAPVLVGSTPAMQEVFKQIGMVSLSDASVLILGDTGTGKELAARAIHAASSRRGKPFVPVHCASIPETLLESELFGFEKGAFTGAVAARAGRFLRAQGGTLFLDEVSDIPPSTQVKLLRVLEDRQVEGLGAGAPTPLDVRIIAATNDDLSAAVEAGRFREDLYFRLNVFALRMPSLRERRDDVPLLARHFLDLFAGPGAEIADEALGALARYDWPGNVRELRNALEHAVVKARGRTLVPEHLPQSLAGGTQLESRAGAVVREAVSRALAEGRGPLFEAVLALFEKPLLQEVMRITGGNQVKAAECLGIHRTTLRRKLEQFGW